MAYPIIRPRRLRRTEAIRSLVRETSLESQDLIYPMFVCEGEGVKEEIPSMPGQYRFSVDLLVEEVADAGNAGVPGVILFGIPDRKDELGSEAYAEGGIVQKAVRALKKSVPDILVITDLCLDEYTSHGHCGVVVDGEVDNDQTLDLLARTALSQVRAGSDMVAPSDMMDGRVAAIRGALDEQGFQKVPILSYAAKYASAFYGPFREAADSAPKFGDRRGYQMDPANAREALKEVALDIQEGADIVMVKPALPYLDVIRRVRDEFAVPVAAFQVSGEYSALVAAGQKGWLNLDAVIFETLTAIKRAGADFILTYFAKEVARKLKPQT